MSSYEAKNKILALMCIMVILNNGAIVVFLLDDTPCVRALLLVNACFFMKLFVDYRESC